MKELHEIKTNGAPPGIELVLSEPLTDWTFEIQVLGDETIYRVRLMSNAVVPN